MPPRFHPIWIYYSVSSAKLPCLYSKLIQMWCQELWKPGLSHCKNFHSHVKLPTGSIWPSKLKAKDKLFDMSHCLSLGIFCSATNPESHGKDWRGKLWFQRKQQSYHQFQWEEFRREPQNLAQVQQQNWLLIERFCIRKPYLVNNIYQIWGISMSINSRIGVNGQKLKKYN